MKSRVKYLAPLFLLSLIIFPNIPFGYSDPTVVYNARQYTANAGINEVSQSDITGSNPNQIVTINYRPQSDTIFMFNAHGFNGTDYGFYYQFDFKVDYDTLSYVILTTASGGGNTTIWESNTGTAIGHLGWNTSFTHVTNNVFLAGIKDLTTVTSDVGNQDDWASLGVSSCTDFVTLTENVYHEFVIQIKNDTGTSGEYAYELFIDTFYWCTYFVSTGANKPTQNLYGNADDLGTGSGTGNVQTQYRQGFVTGGRHPLSLALAGLGPVGGGADEPFDPDEVSGSLSTRTFLQIQNEEDVTIAEAPLSSRLTLRATVLNYSGFPVPIGVMGNVSVHFYRGENAESGTWLGTVLTDNLGAAELDIILDGVHNPGTTISFNATFYGSTLFDAALSSDLQNILITEPGGRVTNEFVSLALPWVTRSSLQPGFEPVAEFVIQGDLIKLNSRIRGEVGVPVPGRNLYFYLDKNNTGTFEVQGFCTTDGTGFCSLGWFNIDTTWTGTSRFFASFRGDAFYLRQNSSIATFTVLTTTAQFALVVTIEPPGEKLQNENFLSIITFSSVVDGIGRPVADNPVSLQMDILGDSSDWVRVWPPIDQSELGITDAMGQVTTSWPGFPDAGSFVFRSVAIVDSLTITSSNLTLVVVADNLGEIPSGQQPGGGAFELEDIFFPECGSTRGQCGFLAWLIFTFATVIGIPIILNVKGMQSAWMGPLAGGIGAVDIVFGAMFGMIPLTLIIILAVTVAFMMWFLFKRTQGQ